MATSGDRYLATSGDFFMATDTRTPDASNAPKSSSAPVVAWPCSPAGGRHSFER